MYKQINKHPRLARPSQFASHTVQCLLDGGAEENKVESAQL